VELCNRFEKGIYAKERDILFLIPRRERRGKGVYSGADEEGIYLTVKVTTDSTSILYGKEGWKKKDSTRLLVF